MRTLLLAGILGLVLLTAGRAEEASPEAAATVVIYNREDPESRALAEYYAKRRGIPEDRLLGLPCPATEEISRDEYLLTIEAPLRVAFNRFGWWERERGPGGEWMVRGSAIRFLAVMRGVPLKIRPDPALAPEPPAVLGGQPAPLAAKNEASVDSELATLFLPGRFATGVMGNPYYRRYAPVLSLPPAETPLLVARLDGPSAAIVRRMIDDSLAAERDGLWGWAYLDARGIEGGPYAVGDEWIAGAGKLMRERGVPVIDDGLPTTFDAGFPVRDAAIYYGWYDGDVSGPFARERRVFVPGAVAVHLHSFNARTVRDAKGAWAGPLLARGAAATLGNVYEPFLELTVHFDVLQERLMSGFTLAEAGYAAMRGVSWMGVIVGDPLYRPYARWNDLRPLTTGGKWAKYRAAVLPAGGPEAAAEALKALAKSLPSSMPLEALGQAQGAGGFVGAALNTLKAAAAMDNPPEVDFRLTLERIEILRRWGRTDEARLILVRALEKFRGEEAQLVLGRIALAIDPPPAPTPTATP